MKKISRKIWYVLLMVVVISGMLLITAGPLYAVGNFDYSPTSKTLNIAAGSSDSFNLDITAPAGNGSFSATVEKSAGGGPNQVPDGWIGLTPASLSFDTTAGDDTETWAVTITVPGGTATGTYTVRLKAHSTTGSPGEAAGMVLTVNVTGESEEDTYTVTFDKNGGDTEASPTSISGIVSGGNVGTLPDPPTRAGYTFMGWNTAADGSGSAFDATTVVTANITVYAQWIPVPPGPGVFNLWATKVGPGSITNPGLFVISAGQSLNYLMTPDSGASIVDVLVNGVSIGAVSSYTFVNVNSNQTIHVIFSSGGVTVAGTVEVAALTELPRTGNNNMLFYVIGFALIAVGAAFGSFFISRSLKKRAN